MPYPRSQTNDCSAYAVSLFSFPAERPPALLPYNRSMDLVLVRNTPRSITTTTAGEK